MPLPHLLPERSIFFVVIVSLCANSVGFATPPIDFNRDIRPLLSDRCFHCHGPDANHREAGLRLDRQEDAHVAAIVPGDAGGSELIERISSEDVDLQMPPADSGKSLKPAEIELLRRWITEGGKYDSHWAFSPPQRPDLPLPNSPWSLNPIDNFVLRKLTDAGLSPSRPIGKEKLLRRVTLDLTGLPPTIQEVDAFMADESDSAYEKVVDRLLESQAYGERMAAVWLDAARYADTMGYQADWERYQWRWRSWVIDAYNRNLPFDEFTVHQIAGDLLPDPTTEQLIATGFNRNHRINDEGGIIPEEYLVEYIVDRVETTSATWLGLTLGCARCHDHKFDPFSQKDFYQIFAFFNGVPEKGKQGRNGYADPYMRVAVRGMDEQYEAVKQRAAEADAQLASQIDGLDQQRKQWVAAKRDELLLQQDSWTVATPRAIESDGVTFNRQSDGSYLATDVQNQHAEYAIHLDAEGERPITGIRLEAIPDPTLSGGKLSPGEGNFYLTDFSVWETNASSDLDNPEVQDAGKMLTISAAEADYEQKGFPVKHVLDDDPKSSWAVDGHAKKERRTAVFKLETPVSVQPGTQFTIRMQHNSPHPGRIVGRWRISLTSDEEPMINPDRGLPKDVIAAIEVDAKKRSSKQIQTIKRYHGSIAKETAAARREQKEAVAALKAFENESTTYVMVMREMERPRPTYILNRGVYDQPGELVSASVPAEVLGSFGEAAPANRLGLARWLVSGKHPLTARVVVNRYWAMLFGRGIVATLEDFGLQGSYPSHPELLDWLATEYPQIGWDTKAMLKLMVMSATYRQSSDTTPALDEFDPKNILLARMSRVRLPAETIRDQALASSGLMVQRIGGPSVKPYQPAGLWSDLSFASKKRSTDFYTQSTGEGLYRRSLYTFWKRSVPPPTMATFDAPSREMCVLQRSRTNTPLQALAMMNDTTYVEASRVLAQRAMRECDKGAKAQIRFAFRSLLTRSPDATELDVLFRGYERRHAYFSQNREAAKSVVEQGQSPIDKETDVVDLAALTTSVMTVMNLDETINRE